MSFYLVLITGFLVVVLLALGYTLARIRRGTSLVKDDPANWANRSYVCPECGEAMSPGYCLAGRGLIWTPQGAKKPGAFAHIGQALDNTISFRLRPALNMAWRCNQCHIVLIDHSKMLARSTR